MNKKLKQRLMLWIMTMFITMVLWCKFHNANWMPYVLGVSVNWDMVRLQLPVEPEPAVKLQHIVEPKPAPIVIVAVSVYATDRKGVILPEYRNDLLEQAGIAEADWNAAQLIIDKESSWRPFVWNTSNSGAYGLCQSLPARKMASAGDDYMTNPVTQLKWCNQYAYERYGGWYQAKQEWLIQGWW